MYFNYSTLYNNITCQMNKFIMQSNIYKQFEMKNKNIVLTFNVFLKCRRYFLLNTMVRTQTSKRTRKTIAKEATTPSILEISTMNDTMCSASLAGDISAPFG